MFCNVMMSEHCQYIAPITCVCWVSVTEHLSQGTPANYRVLRWKKLGLWWRSDDMGWAFVRCFLSVYCAIVAVIRPTIVNSKWLSCLGCCLMDGGGFDVCSPRQWRRAIFTMVQKGDYCIINAARYTLDWGKQSLVTHFVYVVFVVVMCKWFLCLALFFYCEVLLLYKSVYCCQMTNVNFWKSVILKVISVFQFA